MEFTICTGFGSSFNKFYKSEPVIVSEMEYARLVLVDRVRLSFNQKK